jgi:hypothetical protein
MNNQTKLICIGALFMIILSSVIILAVFDDVDGPLIYQIDILPIDPVIGDQISVIAYAIDRSGVANAQLSFTTDGINWEIKDMNFYSCLCLAGGRWVATFGPVSEGAIPEFFITAYDNSPTLNPSDSQIYSIEIDN